MNFSQIAKIGASAAQGGLQGYANSTRPQQQGNGASPQAALLPAIMAYRKRRMMQQKAQQPNGQFDPNAPIDPLQQTDDSNFIDPMPQPPGPPMIGDGMSTPFKDGGVVNKPTYALLGEDGPEMVVPLNDCKDNRVPRYAAQMNYRR